MAHERTGGIRQHVAGRHPVAPEADAQCGRAFQTGEGRAARERHAGIFPVGQEHYFLRPFRGVDHGHGAEIVVGTEVAHPRQQAIDDETIPVGAGLQAVLFQTADALHGVGDAGAAQRLAGGQFEQGVVEGFSVGCALGKQCGCELAPVHETGGGTGFRDLGQRLDGGDVVRTAGQAGQMGTEGAHFAQLAQHLLGVETAVDAFGLGSHRPPRDLAHGGQQRLPVGAVDIVGQGQDVGAGGFIHSGGRHDGVILPEAAHHRARHGSRQGCWIGDGDGVVGWAAARYTDQIRQTPGDAWQAGAHPAHRRCWIRPGRC